MRNPCTLGCVGAGAERNDDAMQGHGGLFHRGILFIIQKQKRHHIFLPLAQLVVLVNTRHSLDNKLNQHAKYVQWVNTVRRLDEARPVTIAGQANTMIRILEL